MYNLKEFAEKHGINNTFGAYAAHAVFYGEESGYDIVPHNEAAHVKSVLGEPAFFTKLILLKKGHADFTLVGQPVHVSAHDVVAVRAQDECCVRGFSADMEMECIFVDEQLTGTSRLLSLPDDKYGSLTDIFHIIGNIVSHQHINKVEMIQGMMHVLRLILDELPYEQCGARHDLHHKKEIYEIFLHHLYRHFRENRQIRFYADKMNVTPAYLSRLVKEISNNTVNDHVKSLVYKEICNLLTQTDLTMGEIAEQLHFSDQSAMTNFFKQRSGMTPLAYRNRE